MLFRSCALSSSENGRPIVTGSRPDSIMGAMGKVGATEIEDMHLTWKKNTGQVSVVGTSKPDGPTGWKGKPLQRSLDGRILRENGWRGMATLVYHWFHFPAAGVLRRHSAGTTVMNADDTHHDTQRARAFERAAELLTAIAQGNNDGQKLRQ